MYTWFAADILLGMCLVSIKSVSSVWVLSEIEVENQKFTLPTQRSVKSHQSPHQPPARLTLFTRDKLLSFPDSPVAPL